MLGVSQSRDLKLFGHEIIFEEFQRMWSRYLIVTDGRTDRRHAISSPRSALASRGKKQVCTENNKIHKKITGKIRAINDDQQPLNVANSQLKTSTVLVARLTHALSVQNMILKDRRVTIRYVAVFEVII